MFLLLSQVYDSIKLQISLTLRTYSDFLQMTLTKRADLLLNYHRFAHVTFYDNFLTLPVYNEYNVPFLVRRAQSEV